MHADARFQIPDEINEVITKASASPVAQGDSGASIAAYTHIVAYTAQHRDHQGLQKHPTKF